MGILTGIPEVIAALKAGQDAGRLPHLSPGTSVDALIKALTLDGLGVSTTSMQLRGTVSRDYAGMHSSSYALRAAGCHLS